MGIEIERKFLLMSDAWRSDVSRSKELHQGYLAGSESASVRVRVEDEAANINIKSATIGIERLEFEYTIPLDEARVMLAELCGGRSVRKIRHYVHVGSHTWEIDEFLDLNRDLIVAEIELTNAEEWFERPSWLGDEVSSDVRYYNVNLIEHPYSTW